MAGEESFKSNKKIKNNNPERSKDLIPKQRSNQQSIYQQNDKSLLSKENTYDTELTNIFKIYMQDLKQNNDYKNICKRSLKKDLIFYIFIKILIIIFFAIDLIFDFLLGKEFYTNSRWFEFSFIVTSFCFPIILNSIEEILNLYSSTKENCGFFPMKYDTLSFNQKIIRTVWIVIKKLTLLDILLR
jgi:hypothetical protein